MERRLEQRVAGVLDRVVREGLGDRRSLQVCLLICKMRAIIVPI